jgi:uncharacterized membrane protein
MSSDKDIEPELPMKMPVHIQQSYHSGPLPPPAIIAQYDEIVPGAAERIIQMAEKSQQQYHSL